MRPKNPISLCRGSARRGASVVEAAVVLPFVILLLFGILEYGRFVMMQQQMNDAAREGARYAATHTAALVLDGSTYGNTTGDVVNAISQRLAGLQLQGQTIEVFHSDDLGNNIGVWSDTPAGERICVRIAGQFPVVANGLLFLPSTLPVQARVMMRSEAN